MLAERLKDNFDSEVRELARSYFAHGMVMNLKNIGPRRVTARVQGTSLYNVALETRGKRMLVECSCPYFHENGCCKHLWATILKLDASKLNFELPGNGKVYVVTQEDLEEEDDLPEEAEVFDAVDELDDANEDEPSKKTPTPTRLAGWERLLLYQPHEFPVQEASVSGGQQSVFILKMTGGVADLGIGLGRRKVRKDGTWGKPRDCRLDSIGPDDFPESVRDIYQILNTESEQYDSWGAESLGFEDWKQKLLIPRLCESDRFFFESTRTGTATQLTLDKGSPWEFTIVLRLSENKKYYMVSGELRRDGASIPLRQAEAILSGGWAVWKNTIAAVDFKGAFGWVTAMHKNNVVQVPASDAPQLLKKLYNHVLPPLDAPEELRLQEVREKMRPSLIFRLHPYNEEEHVEGLLTYWYGDVHITTRAAQKLEADFERKVALARDTEAEKAALERLYSLGFRNGFNGVLELPEEDVPRVATALTRDGWKVEADGKAFKASTSFNMSVSSGVDWFDLEADIDFGGAKATLPALLKALETQSGTVLLDDGSVGILPEEWLKKIAPLARIAEVQDGALRFSKRQAGFLDLLLAEQQNVRMDAPFKQMREELKRFEKIEAVAPPSGFQGELRGYQSEGLGWLYFLQRFGFGGILADDMGLGKTVQVLALLESRRELRERGGKSAAAPSLAVVPKSLIFNWKKEAEKFTPKLKVLDHTGVERVKGTDHLANYDLILTTYGTLRNDAAEFINTRFDYVILDESQAVKNKDTASAKAARLLKADHHLAMSGTPVENHLGELWSLMEFLNPGLLGSASVFEGISNSGRGASDQTVSLLARALKPFILRRTKAQVAKDLPEKLEETIFCEMDKEQRKNYEDLRDYYRRLLVGKIATEGMNKSKIVVLEALLRLRQAACHPGLIDREKLNEGSAKLDALIPLLEEVTEENHKALVFSQFTSFLAILRKRLDELKVPYLYLDGKTTDRESLVNQFQDDPESRLFLISLKAGGVGLNLTAAEYVFLLDPWWNPAVEAQAIDRTHRIGQTRNVFAYRLIAKDTVEEKVLELQKQKRALADAILSSDGSLIRTLTKEDLELLLS